MKSIKIIACVVLLIQLTASGCKKFREEKFTIKGRLVMDCDSLKPVEGATVNLYDVKQNSISYGCTEKINYQTKTDQNGNFEIVYKETCRENLTINIYKDTLKVDLYGVKQNSSIDYGQLVFSATENYNILLETNDSYSSNDTFYYDIQYALQDSTYKFIAGPFSNNQLVKSYFHKIYYYFPPATALEFYNRWRYKWVLRSNGKVIKHDGTAKKFFYTRVPCVKEYNILIDINK